MSPIKNPPSQPDPADDPFAQPDAENQREPDHDPSQAEESDVSTGDPGDPNGPDTPSEPLPEPSDGLLRKRIDVSFLQYASYVIRDRAIPQLDDGMKPVQRRILWTLHEKDDEKLHKVNSIAGACMQYHPHGDASINDAIVNLANKEYLIERQGNYGNIYTGDRAAATRYIECRLTKLARTQLFNDEITEFVTSYDGRYKEPVTLPAKIPLLLMLGAEGIAVGLSCKILSHNFIELLEAQIAVLKNKPFTILPDFIKGGMMDASEYRDGEGAVRVRAKIEIKDASTLTVRELAHGTTTESLINSVEDATKKGKIKVKGIQDYTSESVEIEIKLAPGMDAATTLQALYAFTECEVSLSSRIIVIHENRPREMTVSEVIKHNTYSLKKILERELEIRKGKLLRELHFKTLVRIFVEKRIYKDIEECKTGEAVRQAIFDGFVPHRKQMIRDLVEEDVDMLLAVPIRRISLFDINQHKKEIERIKVEMEEVEAHLSDTVAFTIQHLKGLIKEYAKQFPRRTEIQTFETIAAKEVAAKALQISYDREKGFLGYQVKGEEYVFKCSDYDKIAVLFEDGTFKVIRVPDKLYVGKHLQHSCIADRDHVMTLIYKKKDNAYIKRFNLGGTILNKEYRYIPEKTKIAFFTEGTPKELYLVYKAAPNQKINQQIAYPEELAIKPAKSPGKPLTSKKIATLATKTPRNWDKSLETPKIPLS